jgi:two-component system cell cycle response regulator
VKTLIAEDEPVSRRVLEAFLRKWGYDVLVTCDGSEAWEIFKKPDAPNLVISDWMMPNMNGPDLCRRIREMEKSGYTYFILLTAKGRKEDVIQGFQAGADDFLVKPFDREELKYRVRIGERIIRLEQQILHLATTDSLTGVLNRGAFMERMEEEIHRSVRENSPLSLLLTDIDYFKKINDNYGHQTGDLVLQRFTDQLTRSSRPYDFVGRYGGEEFVVSLPGTGMSRSRAVADRMRKRVEEMKIMPQDGSEPIRITASFGAASLSMDLKENADSLIKQADEAMYRAKREGRNRVCVASENRGIL